jgi:hypothetical protein
VTGSEQLASLQTHAMHDDRIAGLVLSGSAARGMATAMSDVDVYVVLREPVAGWSTTRSYEIDTIYTTLGELATLPSDPGSWGFRWSFAWARVLLDKGGVAQAVHAQATLTDSEVSACLDHYLDGYINFVYRSLKSARDGQAWEQRMDAVESVPWLLWCVFAFANRIRPYNKYLQWELREHPFPNAPWNQVPLTDLLDRILDDGDPAAQRELYQLVEAEAIRRGKRPIIDAWGDDIELLRR